VKYFLIVSRENNYRLLLIRCTSCNFCTTTVHPVQLAISALQQYTLYILQFLHYNSTPSISCNFCTTIVHPVHLAISALQQYTLYILQFLHYSSTLCTSCNFCTTTVHPVNLANSALQQYTCTINSSYATRSQFITLIKIALYVLTHLQ
jgi:hypothetical protein